MSDKQYIIDEILFLLARSENIREKEAFHKMKNTVLARFRDKNGPSGIELIQRYNILVQEWKIVDEIRIRKIIRKRAVRSLSGVAVISLLTKFWGCPWKCVFCPTYEGLPKSYITNEPAVQRAEMNQFDAVKQVQNRLRSLEITGNSIVKCDIRVIWGTWSVYPQEYQENFIRDIYDAHTTYKDLRPHIEAFENKTDAFARFKIREGYKMQASWSLEEAKKRNEIAESRVIGIAIETRPDWVTPEEIIRLRRYGVTRVEIGYQTTDDAINELNKRGHGNRESIKATRLLKDAGFKVVAHMMPGLLGATPEWDIKSMCRVFDDSDFRPDEMKIYPMVVTPHSELADIWEKWEFEPYTDEVLVPLMAKLQSYLPEYIRLNRMYRDIPASEILAWSKLANLRQVTESEMKRQWLSRHDISAREIRAKWNDPYDAILETYFYEASWGHEYFLQYIDPIDRTIFGLLRLRIPSQYFTKEKHFIDSLEWAAIIREVHVFGDSLGVWVLPDGSGQHMGFGKKMIALAEDIVSSKYSWISHIAVISWVWVRGYYEKRGYALQWEYMIKSLIK